MLEKILEEIIEQLKEEGCIIDNDAGNRAEEIIRKHMNDGKDINVPTDNNWIPAEERLPEDGDSVLCTDGKYIYLTEYDADLDVRFDDVDEIIAWQPLPDPYTPKKGAEECQNEES